MLCTMLGTERFIMRKRLPYCILPYQTLISLTATSYTVAVGTTRRYLENWPYLLSQRSPPCCIYLPGHGSYYSRSRNFNLWTCFSPFLCLTFSVSVVLRVHIATWRFSVSQKRICVESTRFRRSSAVYGD